MPYNNYELTNPWSQEELGTIHLGDKRLNERLLYVAEELSAYPQSPINAACGDWKDTKAAYRLFDNENVTPEKIMDPHFRRTVQRMGEHRRVFAVQDTTYLDYTHHPLTEGLGPIGTKSQQIYGLIKHTTLVLTESGLPLGVLTDEVWVRDETEPDTPKENKPISEKESYKWIKALNQTQAQTPQGVEVISICDREADIYEFFIEAADTCFVIRAVQNRVIDDETGKLNALVKNQPCAGALVVDVPQKNNEPAREATVSVHFASTTLVPTIRPLKNQPQQLPPIDVSVVWVTEMNPPAGVTPLEWLLITNVAVNDFSAAIERIRGYGLRWQIEVYFKVLKSGNKIEDCRLQTKERLLRYLALKSVIAWRLYWLTMMNRHAPDADCTRVLTDHEWKALYCVTHRTTALPKKVPTVSEGVVWIAKLGGFLGRKSDGEPGVTVIWRGWQRLSDISETFFLLQTPV